MDAREAVWQHSKKEWCLRTSRNSVNMQVSWSEYRNERERRTREISACLPHDPHGSTGGLFAVGCTEEEVILERGELDVPPRVDKVEFGDCVGHCGLWYVYLKTQRGK